MDTKVIKSILILAVCSIGLILTTPNPAYLFKDSYANYKVLLSAFTPCKKVQSFNFDRKVILRIDDIQAYAWPDVTKKMIDDALSKQAPLTLAVIPNNLDQDKELIGFLQKRSCNLEFALHGWDHSDNPAEFANLNYDEAKTKISNGIRMLALLGNKKVVTFIPPQNQYSDATLKALNDEDIHVISSEGDGQYDYDATTYDFLNNKLNTSDYVLSECSKTFVDSNYCIVMIHPQDYTTNGEFDQTKYETYLNMIDGFKRNGDSFTTIADMAINKSSFDIKNF